MKAHYCTNLGRIIQGDILIEESALQCPVYVSGQSLDLRRDK